MTRRIEAIDVAKGILILLVIWGHIGWCLIDCCGIQNTVLSQYRYIFDQLIKPFYLCAFFAIRGFCSKWEKTPKETFISDSLSLLLPMVIFSTHHFAWFCMAMLVDSTLYSVLRVKIGKLIIFFANVTIIAYIGVLLHKHGYDWSFISFALPHVFFIFMGDKLLKIESKKFHKWIFAIR